MLDFVEKFEPGARAKVLSHFPKASLEALELAPRTSWLPVEHDHFVVDGVVAVLGKDRARKCWRDSVPDMVDKPLLRSFVSGMVRMFGREPARIVGLLPKAWPLVYRDMGTVTLDASTPGDPVLRFSDIPRSVRAYPNYFVSWEGVCAGLAHIARVTGDATLVPAPDLSSAEVRFRWG